MKTILVAALFVSLLFLFGCPFLGPEQPAAKTNKTIQNQTPMKQPVVEIPPQPPAEPAKNQTAVLPENETALPQPLPPALRMRAGYANTAEIGGSGFVVVSGYDSGSAITFENASGKKSYFNTTVSRERSHIVYLMDKEYILRAMSVSLPLDPAYLVFDARSTAKAVLWAGGNLSQMENERLLAQIGYLNCWGNLYGYLQRKLPKNNVDNLTEKDWDYNSYRDVCIKEMNKTGLPAPD